MNNNKISTLVTRGKIASARIAPRTLLQVTGLDGETFSNIELLVPPGYVANPIAGGDVLLLQVNGVRGHVVAIVGDNTADTLANLQPGESGLAHDGKSVLLRVDQIAITDPQKIVLQAPLLQWTPDGVNFYTLATSAHTHDTPDGVSQPPNTSAGMLSS